MYIYTSRCTFTTPVSSGSLIWLDNGHPKNSNIINTENITTLIMDYVLVGMATYNTLMLE